MEIFKHDHSRTPLRIQDTSLAQQFFHLLGFDLVRPVFRQGFWGWLLLRSLATLWLHLGFRLGQRSSNLSFADVTFFWGKLGAGELARAFVEGILAHMRDAGILAR